MTSSGFDGPMSPCVEIRKLAHEFLDAELSTSEWTRVDAHLEACPPCARYVAFERAFLAVIRRRTTVEQAPAELRDRLRAALARAEEKRRPT